jgi:hypothetical protein
MILSIVLERLDCNINSLSEFESDGHRLSNNLDGAYYFQTKLAGLVTVGSETAQTPVKIKDIKRTRLVLMYVITLCFRAVDLAIIVADTPSNSLDEPGTACISSLCLNIET